jgi:hypothetical protein
VTRIGRSPLSISALVAATVAISACGGNSTGATTGFDLTVDTAAASTLGRSVTFHAHLVSHGSSGAVTLNVTGAPGTWTVTPSAATLPQNGQTTADVVVAIPSNGDAAPTGQSLAIEATVGALSDTARTAVTVANQYILPILQGAGSAGGHWGTLALTTVHLNVGTMLTFRNDDTTAHLIHANATIAGLVHQNTGGPGTIPGGTYDQTLTGTGTDQVYCHSHTSADWIRITVP